MGMTFDGGDNGDSKKFKAGDVLTDTELLLALARASLREYGTVVPPKEILMQIAKGHCPRCDHEGPLETDFGFRTVNGKRSYQSWCKRCRASSASHPAREAGAKRERKKL